MANQNKAALQQQQLAVAQSSNTNELFQMLAALNEQEGTTTRWQPSSIIYTSRTHSQLTQAMKELKNSAYNDVNAVSLGSRDQLCINTEVLNEGKTSAERNNLCQIKTKKKACMYRDRVDKISNNVEMVKHPIKDIEDLVEVGKKCRACPYYLSRELATKADIIFMPYNYLLDAKILKSFKINLKDAVVILDEAHNVERVCEDTASIHFSSSDIATCINDITHIMKCLEKDDEMLMLQDENVEKDFTIEDLAKLKEIMLNFEEQIDKIDSVFSNKGRTFPGGKLFELLTAANITHVSYPMIKQLMDALILYLTQSTAGSMFGRKGSGLMKMLEVFDTAYGSMGVNSYETYKAQMEKGYRVHVEIEPEKKKNDGNTTGLWLSTSAQSKLSKSPKIINYWCFAPGFGMANLLARDVRSIILTSGTLAPLKPLISELAIKIDQQLENPHIIKESQVAVKIVSAGPDKEPLDSSYQNRDNPKYMKSLGLTIQALCRITPNGVLIFFSSYTLMNKCKDVWTSSGIWQGIQDIKPIFLEPRDKEEFGISVRDYYETVKVRKGAIYMAVLRGKVSEGIDFNDHNARAVIICGIPFPPSFDPRVTLKKSYLDQNRNKENQLQSGQEWYVLEAVRAVNQAIGRVIRHKDDYGAILLCDARFHNQKTQLSKWIQPHLMKQQRGDINFGKIIGELARFFRTNEETSIQPKERSIDVKQPIKIEYEEDTKPIDTKDIVKQQIKLENSIDIYGTSSKVKTAEDIAEVDNYVKEMKMKKNNSSGSLFNELNKDVAVIDFNSTTPSTSFKMPRSYDLAKEEENASKKRRLKMIPNANSIPGEETSNFEGLKIKVPIEFWEREYPKERAKFLEAVINFKLFFYFF